MKREYVSEYDMTRVIATLLVIISHCSYYTIISNYGFCDYSAFTLPEESLVWRFARLLSMLIYGFHMPFFMMLSGALFQLKSVWGGGIPICNHWL